MVSIVHNNTNNTRQDILIAYNLPNMYKNNTKLIRITLRFSRTATRHATPAISMGVHH